MSSPGPLSLALADFTVVAEAQRLADRLIVAEIGAAVGTTNQGFRVWVRRADYEDAKILMGLFDEIDAGVSHVAPTPASFWQRSRADRNVAIFSLVVVMCLLLVLLRLAALR